MDEEKGFEKISNIFSNTTPRKKPPTYEWQELALKIIKDLNIPNNKRSSVFKACKTKSKPIIEKALNDTKELCKTKEKWKYFFKILNV